MSEENKDYDLYTEHIVKTPWTRIKRWIKKGLVVFALAVFFGLVAGLVMLVVYKGGKRFVDPPTANAGIDLNENETASDEQTEEDTKEPITLPPVEDNTEEATDKPEIPSGGNNGVLDDYKEIYGALKNIANGVNKSMVTVTVAREDVDWFNSTYQNITEEIGIVIAKDSTGFYVLTDYSLIRNAGSIVITYPDGSTDTAAVEAGDFTTDLAVLKTAKATNKSVEVAVLGDSSVVEKGDLIVAVGKLYGFAGSMGYGMATGVNNVVNDTDSSYKLINTDIAGTENSSGVLVNLNGQIVGIITTGYSSGNSRLIAAYAISGVRDLIQNLSNAIDTPYLGIKGQEVTPALKLAYDIPDGVYVTAIETNSPAYFAGIQMGDVICALENEQITTMEEFMKALRGHKPNEAVRLTVKRKGRDTYKEIEFNLMLGVE